MIYANSVQPKSRQLRGAELIAAGFPELATSKNTEGRQRAAIPVNGQKSPKSSVDQRPKAVSIEKHHLPCKENGWTCSPEMSRYIKSLFDCPTDAAGMHMWMVNVARNAVAIGQDPDFAKELIPKLLPCPPSSPDEVAEVVDAAYAQQGGAQ